MGVNDDRLLPREHADMRNVILDGAKRIKPAGAHRKQLVAGALSLVLVGLLAAGAVTTSYFVGANNLASTPSPTPTVRSTEIPTPSPTPTETPVAPPVPLGAIAPFGGDCQNVVDGAWLDSVYEAQMSEPALSWENPATVLSGGIDCLWTTDGSYMNHIFSVRAFPISGGDRGTLPAVCEGETVRVCRIAVESAGTWIVISATDERADESLMTSAATQVAARASLYPAPRAAERDDAWWSVPDCSTLYDAFPDDWTTDVRPLTQYDGPSYPLDAIESAVRKAEGGFITSCAWDVRSIDEYVEWVTMSVEIIPGGGGEFDRIAATSSAQPLAVEGVEDAVLVEDNYRWEKYSPALVVRDGSNLLILRGDNGLPPENLSPLARPFLDAINSHQ